MPSKPPVEPPPASRRSRLRALVVDVSPLRDSKQFRLLYFGQMVSFIGSQITVVAVPVQVYSITRSTLDVGLLGLVQLVPLLLCSLLGGSIADAFDRRKVLLVTQVLLALCSVGLAVNASLVHHLWIIYVLMAASAAFVGIDSPARNASVARMVTAEQFSAAAALQQTLMQVGVVVGPAIGGLLIAEVSIAAAFWVDVATFGAALTAVLLMKPLPPEHGGTKVGFASIREGVRYLKGRQALQGTFVIDINAMVFGMPRAVFPELAARVFGGGPGTVGLLYAAPGAGALFGALGSGWVTRVRRQGLAVLVAVAVWGGAIALVGITPWLWLALALLAVAGAADVVSAVFRNTILQLSVPDRLRGRLSAIHLGVVQGGPRLGDAETGAATAVIGPRGAVVTGGLACVVGVAVIGRLMPGLARWTRASLADDPDLQPPPDLEGIAPA